MAGHDDTTFAQLEFSFSEPEIWRPVAEWEGFYEISNLGRVRGCERRVLIPATRSRGPTWKRIKSQMRRPTHGGANRPYPRVYLWRDHVGFSKMVHHMVLEAFVGPKPIDAVANHIDGDKQNNHVGNLEWCSRSRNNLHAIETGLVHFVCKYSPEQVRMVRRLLKDGMSLVAISRQSEMPIGSVHNIVRRRTWKHLKD